jgi:hypothetical protein
MKKRYFRSLSPGLLVALTALACILSACPTGNDEPDDSIVLNGTIGKVTVNGASYSGEIFIQARKPNNDWMGEIWYNTNGSNDWSMAISADMESGTSINFWVNVRIDDKWVAELHKSIGVTQTYNGSDISDIALGDVALP